MTEFVGNVRGRTSFIYWRILAAKQSLERTPSIFIVATDWLPGRKSWDFATYQALGLRIEVSMSSRERTFCWQVDNLTGHDMMAKKIRAWGRLPMLTAVSRHQTDDTWNGLIPGLRLPCFTTRTLLRKSWRISICWPRSWKTLDSTVSSRKRQGPVTVLANHWA